MRHYRIDREALAKGIEGLGQTNADVAVALGVSTATIARVRAGTAEPSARLAKKLADHIGLPLGEFLILREPAA